MSSPALATLAGQSIHGDWALEVADFDAADTGMLKRWDLEITYAPSGPSHAEAAS